jgi:GT2 family glycosyltransferase
MNDVRLTIGITTRDRPLALERCLRSLAVVAHLAPEVLVFDDGSSPSASEQISGWALPVPVRVLRDDRSPGAAIGRNRMVRESSAPAVFLMDDDAAFLKADEVERAVRLLEADGQIGAIAFAQCDLTGARWDEGMQPGPGRVVCYVAAFIGFAHLLRRSLFIAIGGYRETFGMMGEEKELCLRMVDSGYRTVYLPEALVIHQPDPASRSQRRYLRAVTKNDCLTALYNEPFSRLAWLLPARLALYFRMRRAWKVDDPWGWVWILRELFRCAGSVFRDRKPVSRETVETWKRLRKRPEPYLPPEGGSHAAQNREP